MSILIKLISFILLFYSISTTKLKDGDNVSLVYYEYDYNISEINLILLNRDIEIAEDEVYHLAFVHNTADINNIMDFYSIYFNQIWIFFSDNKTIIKHLINYDYDEEKLQCKGIIFPQGIQTEIEGISDYNGIPMFAIEDNYTDIMEQWDLRNMNKNIFFTYKIYFANSAFPFIYFLVLSITLLTLGLTLIITWKISLKTLERRYILSFHDLGVCLIYINIIICAQLLFLSFLLKGQKIYQISAGPKIFTLILSIFIFMHRTFLWIVVVLISCGWGISLEQLNQQTCSLFFKMYFFLLIAFVSDEFLDLLVNPIWNLKITEIKNFFVYLLLLVITSKKIRKNINGLKRKLNFARLYSPVHLEALNYKIKVFYLLLILIIGYFIAYTSALILHKTIFYPWDESQLEMYDYSAIEFIFTFTLFIALRPKILPSNYNSYLGDDIDEGEENIYNYNLPKYSEMNLKYRDPSKKEIESCKKDDMPILIIGPTNSEDNIDDTNINKYFLELNIGFVEKNK